MSSIAWVVEVLWWFALALLVASLVYWLGIRYGLRHPEVRVPPRPTRCAFCGGRLRSELVWSSVCQVCDRGQVGPFDTKGASGTHLGWVGVGKSKRAPPFVSHVDVAARHASDSPGGYPWRHL